MGKIKEFVLSFTYKGKKDKVSVRTNNFKMSIDLAKLALSGTKWH